MFVSMLLTGQGPSLGSLSSMGVLEKYEVEAQGPENYPGTTYIRIMVRRFVGVIIDNLSYGKVQISAIRMEEWVKLFSVLMLHQAEYAL